MSWLSKGKFFENDKVAIQFVIVILLMLGIFLVFQFFVLNPYATLKKGARNLCNAYAEDTGISFECFHLKDADLKIAPFDSVATVRCVFVWEDRFDNAWEESLRFHTFHIKKADLEKWACCNEEGGCEG